MRQKSCANWDSNIMENTKCGDGTAEASLSVRKRRRVSEPRVESSVHQSRGIMNVLA